MQAMCRLMSIIVVGVLGGCADTGGGYDPGSYVSHRDPWYHHGGYYYDEIYVPDYPDRNPGDRPDPPDSGVRPTHPIARPERPSDRPSIPSRTRPMGSSFGGFSRGGGLRGR